MWIKNSPGNPGNGMDGRKIKPKMQYGVLLQQRNSRNHWPAFFAVDFSMSSQGRNSPCFETYDQHAEQSRSPRIDAGAFALQYRSNRFPLRFTLGHPGILHRMTPDSDPEKRARKRYPRSALRWSRRLLEGISPLFLSRTSMPSKHIAREVQQVHHWSSAAEIEYPFSLEYRNEARDKFHEVGCLGSHSPVAVEMPYLRASSSARQDTMYPGCLWPKILPPKYCIWSCLYLVEDEAHQTKWSWPPQESWKMGLVD